MQKNEIRKNGILSEEAQISVCKFGITCVLCRYSYETIVHRSTDNNLVRTVIPKVASNIVTTVFLLQMTDESHSKLCVAGTYRQGGSRGFAQTPLLASICTA